MKYQTLVFTDNRKNSLGPYVYIDGPDVYGAITPTLMPMTATMDLLRDLNPRIDFSDIQMVTVELKHVD
tara:strand:- start:542 stop:748 length:207 start_codon:yes stop_codon:yes gene_type:complete